MSTKTEAQELLAGNRSFAGRLAGQLIKPLNDNFVERPWGGRELPTFKRAAAAANRMPFGESFELAAADDDAEARLHPSVIRFADGSEAPLPALLALHGEQLLGAPFIRRYGARLPLLPKFLDVAELLSVQAHPAGNTEVYVIVSADPGATIRLGFAADVDAAALETRLAAGLHEQRRLLELVGADAEAALHAHLQGWFADRNASPAALEHVLRPLLRDGTVWPEVEAIAGRLRELYWHVLGLLNELPVAAGQVIFNANPERIVAAVGGLRSAEVHALGNPERREILALEIRRPGPTFRAWDHVRFPLRDIDVAGALAALNLRATNPAEYFVTPVPVAGRPGVSRSVQSEHFRLEHLAPTALAAVTVPATPPHSLHVMDGAVSVYATDGALVGRLGRGDSALVPVGVGAYRVAADSAAANVVKVDLPPYAD